MHAAHEEQTSGTVLEAAGGRPLDGHRRALLLLVLAYTLSIADRMVLSVLFPNIKAEFGLSDAELGLLGGFSFALFYATLGIPIARLADRYSRKIIIVVSLIIFSLMTALSGWAAGLVSLFIFRIGVGIGEAGVNPASHSIIADYFPTHRRAFAMAILMLGANAGMILGFVAGGVVAEYYGWRVALMSVGFPGLLLAVVFVRLFREPPRGGFDNNRKPNVSPEPPPPIRKTAQYLWSNRALRHLLLGSVVIGMLANGLMQWMPTFFMRNHEMAQSQVGVLMALFFGALGATGALVSGKLADRFSSKGFEYGMWMVAGAMALAIPFWMVAFLVDNLGLALALFIIPAFTGNCYLGPSLALIQTLSPVPMRAVASAITMFCLNLIGMGLGPLIVGLLSDALTPWFDGAALQVALACFSFLGLWGAIHFVLCGKALARQTQNHKREV